MRREWGIATLHRRLMLLSDRVEYCCPDKELLIDRLLGLCIPISELDIGLVLQATELDRLCAHFIRALRERHNKFLIEALGVMSADRVIACHYALPPSKQVKALRDVAWAYQVTENCPFGTERAIQALAVLAADTQWHAANRSRNHPNDKAATPARNAFEQVRRNYLRMEVGLPVDDAMKPAAVLRVFTEELAKLGGEPNDAEFGAAMERAVERCHTL